MVKGSSTTGGGVGEKSTLSKSLRRPLHEHVPGELWEATDDEKDKRRQRELLMSRDDLLKLSHLAGQKMTKSYADPKYCVFYNEHIHCYYPGLRFAC
jgi:hypothetical protein